MLRTLGFEGVMWNLMKTVFLTNKISQIHSPWNKNNRICHYVAGETSESHPSVEDLQSPTRLAKSWRLQIVDTRMRFTSFPSIMLTPSWVAMTRRRYEDWSEFPICRSKFHFELWPWVKFRWWTVTPITGLSSTWPWSPFNVQLRPGVTL